MEAVLVWYTLLNLAILGLIVLFVRASRARAIPNERQDLEENALVAADWVMVCRERCLPSGCPRLKGQPPQPRKDVSCEICAATFLEIRLQRLLDGPLAAEPADAGAEGLMPDRGIWSAHRVTASVSKPRTVRGEAREWEGCSFDTRLGRAAREPRIEGVAMRWAGVRVGLGIGCVAAGAIATFGSVLWLIIPGCLLMLLGLGLIAFSAVSRVV